MPSTLRDICFDCADQTALAGFWAEVLGYELRPSHPGPEDPVVIIPPDASGLRIWFNKVPEPKISKNRVHIDVNMTDGDEMARLEQLGARQVREIRDDAGTLHWTIMADPEGNEFCAFPPRD